MEKFTAVFQQSGEWWTGYVEELPGANTRERTLEEARENLKEAVRLTIEANRELARPEAGEEAGGLRNPEVICNVGLVVDGNFNMKSGVS